MKKLISIILTITLSISMASWSGVFANTKPSIKETFFNKIETVKNLFVGEKEPEYATLPRDTDFAEPSIYDSHSAQLVDYSFLFTQMTNWNILYQTFKSTFNKSYNHGLTSEEEAIFSASLLKNAFKILTNLGLDGLFTHYESQKFQNDPIVFNKRLLVKEFLPMLLQFPRILCLLLSKLTNENIEEIKNSFLEFWEYFRNA